MKTRIRPFTYTLIPVLYLVLYKIYMYNTIISITLNMYLQDEYLCINIRIRSKVIPIIIHIFTLSRNTYTYMTTHNNNNTKCLH